MMIARARGMRCVPFLRSLIQRTIGARMNAIKNAKMNGSRTLRPRNAMKTTNSGKPHRERNFLEGAFSPNHVSRVRVREVRPGGSGDVVVCVIVVDVMTGPLSTGRGTAPPEPGGSSLDSG